MHIKASFLHIILGFICRKEILNRRLRITVDGEAGTPALLF